MDSFEVDTPIIYIEKVKAVNPKIIFDLLNNLKNEIDREEKEGRRKKLIKKRFIISFLFWTGVRVNEFRKTLKKYIDFIGLTYYVPTLKRRTSNVLVPIPLNHVPKSELRFWVYYFDLFNIKQDDYIIDVSDRAIRKLVDKEFRKYNLDVNPHMLRHSLGYFLASMKVDIRYIREVLRHVNIANTMIYTKPFMEDLRRELEYVREKVEKDRILK